VTWVQIVAGLIGAIATLVAWLKDRQAIEAGVAQAVSAQLQGALDEIKRANAARDRVRADIAADADSVRRPDKHSRD
jgi:hypothetical protein